MPDSTSGVSVRSDLILEELLWAMFTYVNTNNNYSDKNYETNGIIGIRCVCVCVFRQRKGRGRGDGMEEKMYAIEVSTIAM